MSEKESETCSKNSYYEAFDAIAAALDAIAKAITPDESDDAAPPETVERPRCNSYFASFGNIADALARVKDAVRERLAAEEKDSGFAAWRESYAISLGKGARTASNGIAIGWNSTAGSGTGTGARDAGAVAVGKASGAYGMDAVALGRNAVAGSPSSRTTQSTVQLGSGTNTADGTLQFRSWQLVGADGLIPAGRLPPGAGGIVEAACAFGAADDRTTGLWHAVFTLEGLGIAAKSVCMKSVSFICSNNSTLPSADVRKLEIKTGDGAVLLAASAESAAFDTAGAVVKFTFPEAVELKSGVRYRLKLVDGTGANKAAPVMLASTAGAGGYLASFINGTGADRTDFFPCISFTVLKPAPDIATALEKAGAFALAFPSVSDGSVALADQSVNAVTFGEAPVALSFPERTDGFARSFVVRIAASAGSDARWTLPDDVSFESGENDALGDVPAGETAVIAFMEIAENVFMVSRKTVTPVAKEV